MQPSQPRRHNTCPARLKNKFKRDVPAVWDLFALDDRAADAVPFARVFRPGSLDR